MANEVTTAAGSVGELVAAEMVSRLVIDAAYGTGGLAVMPRIVRVADISAESTLTVEFPKWPLLTAAALTEGTDASNSAINTTSVSITASEAGIMVTVTDKLLGSAVTGGLEPFAVELGKALAGYIDTTLLAAVSSFTNSVGTSGLNMTHQNFIDAIYTLENGAAIGPFVCVLHPIQVSDLRTSLTTSGLASWDATANSEIGSMGSLFGIPIVQSTNCASVNTNADRLGVLMPLGNQSGLAMVAKRAARTEFQRDASLRATEIVVTTEFGAGCVNIAANGGVAIITDHE